MILEKVKSMNSDKHIKIYIMLSSLLLIIVVVGIIIGFGHKLRYKENNNKKVKVESYTKGKEYTVDLIKTNATVTFNTSQVNPLTGDNEIDTSVCYLYYDSSFKVYYRGYNNIYVPYLKDDGSWYKWNVEKGEVE